MGDCTLITNHARALMCIPHAPGVRLRDIAATLGITERRAYGIVTDLTTAGYVVKDKDGRRNRYQVGGDQPIRGAINQQRTIGEVLDLLVDTNSRRQGENGARRDVRARRSRAVAK